MAGPRPNRKEVINIKDLKLIQEMIKSYQDGAQGASLGLELSGKPDDWKRGFNHAFECVDAIFKEYFVGAEKECLALIDELIDDSYWMLRNFAKNQPESFYIDDRVSIKDEKKIYEAVKRLVEIRQKI